MNLFSFDAEASVIGSAFIEPDLIAELADIVKTDDLYHYEHRVVWGALINTAKQGGSTDIVTISEYLESIGVLDDIGGMAALAEMTRNTPSANNAKAYAEIVADLAQRRRLADLMPETEATFADRQSDTDTLITQAVSRLEAMRRSRKNQLLRAADYLGEQFVDPLDRRANGDEDAMGLPYGLKELDEATLGMKDNELVIVGGRPSMGKTAFMMNCLRAALNTHAPVLVESLEMKRPALFNRLIASIGDIPLAVLYDPRNNDIDAYWSRLSFPVVQVKESNLYINDETPRTISQIRAQAKEIYDRHGRIGLVMIDYLGKVRIEGDYGSRHDRAIEEVVAGAKSIAKEFSCPVMLLSQLNRKLEDRPNKRPNMGDLKDSSAIEQEADTILFLYRDEVYHPDNPDSKGIAEIIIGKQREGRTDTIHVASRLANARFEDLAPRHYEESFS
ncbi:replicative DNA helicase [Vreelandella andesensis]|uniref:DNA 5'-3' helicase n=1 Tax=Vreelandella andesensis TaxID=447567 RepID=A0A433KF38_9GAMM|nr:replicative DNA helicase [Halomonas andesensis]RUR26819.1 replicative DNA helicase [Halomonas andesensis]